MTATGGDIVITARDLTKRYGKAHVVDRINFDIAKGETFGLLGPNGAGKTTTILMMLGLTEISGGTVRVLGSHRWADDRMIVVARLRTRLTVPDERSVARVPTQCATGHGLHVVRHRKTAQ